MKLEIRVAHDDTNKRWQIEATYTHDDGTASTHNLGRGNRPYHQVATASKAARMIATTLAQDPQNEVTLRLPSGEVEPITPRKPT